MGVPKRDLTGIKLGNLEVLYYTKKGRWMCKCTCGKETCRGMVEVRGWDIIQGRRQGCSATSKEEDLTNKQINELFVIKKNGDGTWLCKCYCGNIVSLADRGLRSRTTKTCGHNFSSYIDMKDQIFGELTAKKYLGNGMWECECSCGKVIEARGTDIRSGNTRSCGHTRAKSHTINLKGKQFGDWDVLEYSGDAHWKCRCSCGTERDVHGYSLRHGLSTCCGLAVHRYINMRDCVVGELTVKEYRGNGKWLCECSCGNIKEILGINLRNGSTHSCGCKTDELIKLTLYDKYGEIYPSRIHNPRETNQIIVLRNREYFENLLDLYKEKYNYKPFASNIAEILGVTPSTIIRYAKDYNVLDKFNNGSGSSYENTLAELFHNENMIRNSKQILKSGKELDFYFPDRGMAIEFNGNYWHSIAFKSKLYHQEKSFEALNQGIRLIHIFEYEWYNINKRDKIIELIDFELHKLRKEVIHGRVCEVREISEREAYQFLNAYHLQGCATASVNLGLYDRDELVGVMTFGKPRFNPNYEWELIRLCWEQNVRVVGGASKLFKYFLNKYNPNNIISYCDISKFSGKVYEKLKFKLDGITEPGYVWVNKYTQDVLSRYQTMKHKLVEMGLGSEDQTEDEIMENLGYLKIYDCGNLRYIWSNNK